jgi:hypothetical protein
MSRKYESPAAKEKYDQAFAQWCVATFNLFQAIGVKKEDYKATVDSMMNALQLRLLNRKIQSTLSKLS